MSRHSQPVPPVSGPSNLRPTTVGASREPQGTQSGGQAPKAFCKFDEHIMQLAPTYKPLNEKELHDFMFSCGATEATLGHWLRVYDKAAEQMIERGGARVIGVKPLPDDPNVYIIRIPESRFVLRLWDGGMEYYNQFCLDFFDTELRAPVNLPPGHGLYPGLVMPPGFGVGPPPPNYYIPKCVRTTPKPREHRSWERNLGMDSCPEGEEKWSFPEGSCLSLKRDGYPDFMFQVPSRQPMVYGAQAQRGLPY